jgi:hypothetical protein
MKECSKCKEKKDLSFFTKLKKSKDGLSYWCKECRKKSQYKWLQKNKEKIKAYNKKNKEKIKAYRKKYYEKNKEKMKENAARWHKNNPEKVKEKNRRGVKKWNEKHSFKSRIIGLIKQSLYRKGFSSNLKWDKIESDILGCNYDFLQNYLNETFKKNYNIDIKNAIEKIHIDHIKPISSAETMDEILKLNHYTNLQYLYASDNISKYNKKTFKLKEKIRVKLKNSMYVEMKTLISIEEEAKKIKNQKILDLIQEAKKNVNWKLL